MTAPATLFIEREFMAAPERVFAAFEDIGAWWSPAELKVVTAENDFRVGGRFRLVMAPPGSGLQVIVTGRYLEIERPWRLVFTHVFQGDDPWTHEVGLIDRDTRVEIELQATADGTRLTLTQSELPEAAREAIGGGWGGILEGLAAYLRQA